MTLFIQNDTGGAGTGSVLPNNAEADLFMISNSDLGLGETTQPAPSDLIQVTYATQNQHGPCPDRLHDLVTTDFTMVPAHPVDIIVLAVDDSFTLVNGTPVSQVGGTAMPPAFTLGGTRVNPTNSILVLYDVGESLCEKGEASGNYDLTTTGPVTLYHELSHALRIATNTSLSLTPPSPCGASPEEHAAEVDENDMRNQLGVPRRDANDHCAQVCPGGGGGGGGSCCIVASIATGSQSIEVNSLRSLRDGFLRRSEVGHAFFARLHYDYYAFSPQVCTAMGDNPALVDRIRAFCVRPLTTALTLIRALLADGEPAASAGNRLHDDLTRPDGLAHARPEELEGALAMVRAGRVDTDALPIDADLPVTGAVAPTEHIRWALLDPVEMYLEAALECRAGAEAEELGERFAERVAAWAPRIPLDRVWSVLSDYETLAELGFLADCLLRTPAAREQFGARLAGSAQDPSRARQLLSTAGYPVAEVLS